MHLGKKLLGLIVFVSFLIVPTPVFADSKCPMKGDAQCPMSASKDCDKSSHDCGKSGCDSGGSQCPITNKFFKKVKFLLNNKDEIGLTDAQVDTIKSLKLDMKKAGIRQMADMQIFMLEIESKLAEDTINVEEMNQMFDQASAGMTAAGKGAIQNYAKLKATLTPEQLEKAKAIWSGKSLTKSATHSA